VRSELARRIAFTLGALLLFRLGTYIPVPGINPAVWNQFMRAQDGSILGVFNVMSAGAVGRLSIFALGILPYVSAAVILQLVAYFSARLRRLQSSGESGRRRLETYTRIFTLAMALFQSAGIASALADIDRLVTAPGPLFVVSVTLTMTGGTMFLIWLSRQITLRGLGNGVALILCTGVIFELMNAKFTLTELQRTAEAISGRRLHKQNFRRLVETGALVEETGDTTTATGGRPAALFRFRREVLQERPSPGLRLGAR